jgi:hypothetical protein
MAAWRSGGFHYLCAGTLPFKFALPAAVAPNRSLHAGILSVLSSQTTLIFLFFQTNLLTITHSMSNLFNGYEKKCKKSLSHKNFSVSLRHLIRTAVSAG